MPAFSFAQPEAQPCCVPSSYRFVLNFVGHTIGLLVYCSRPQFAADSFAITTGIAAKTLVVFVELRISTFASRHPGTVVALTQASAIMNICPRLADMMDGRCGSDPREYYLSQIMTYQGRVSTLARRHVHRTLKSHNDEECMYLYRSCAHLGRLPCSRGTVGSIKACVA